MDVVAEETITIESGTGESEKLAEVANHAIDSLEEATENLAEAISEVADNSPTEDVPTETVEEHHHEEEEWRAHLESHENRIAHLEEMVGLLVVAKTEEKVAETEKEVAEAEEEVGASETVESVAEAAESATAEETNTSTPEQDSTIAPPPERNAPEPPAWKRIARNLGFGYNR